MEDSKGTAPENEAVPLKIKSDALRLLSFRARSVDELRKRLRLKKHPADLIEKEIETLKSQGFLDDEKFAKIYTAAKTFTNPAGRRRLEIELKAKGVAGSTIQKTLSEFSDEDEQKIAFDLARGRFDRMKDLPDQKKKARIYGFLKRKGFGDGIVYKVLSDLLKGNVEIDD